MRIWIYVLYILFNYCFFNSFIRNRKKASVAIIQVVLIVLLALLSFVGILMLKENLEMMQKPFLILNLNKKK
ncbi:hypothetical protein XFF6991_4924 [Xanthomonas phaseoli pv. phaseoli]|uniref:Uncharacterized protein n=1 Tax=Xanthomonas campestris pv. phaseoli TaxID=317013 RepID=A0A7Z7IV88_XANCH|nr:hypothetical protein XFF6991_4924 [Xanthomonas phaseoli pv. phaseoli]